MFYRHQEQSDWNASLWSIQRSWHGLQWNRHFSSAYRSLSTCVHFAASQWETDNRQQLSYCRFEPDGHSRHLSYAHGLAQHSQQVTCKVDSYLCLSQISFPARNSSRSCAGAELQPASHASLYWRRTPRWASSCCLYSLRDKRACESRRWNWASQVWHGQILCLHPLSSKLQPRHPPLWN